MCSKLGSELMFGGICSCIRTDGHFQKLALWWTVHNKFVYSKLGSDLMVGEGRERESTHLYVFAPLCLCVRIVNWVAI